MKKIKKVLALTLIFVMLMSVNSFAYNMYSLDGRKINVDYNSAQSWRNVGWYDSPVTEMYAPDGRTTVVYISDVTAWKNVGWRTSLIPSSNEECKNEYAYVLQNLIKEGNYYDISHASFSLVYINDDDIPELVYRYDECHSAEASVYSYVNGKVVHIGKFGEFGDILYQPRANRFTSQYWGMGGEHICLYKMSAGSASKIIELKSFNHELYPDATYYQVNNQKVTYSKYMKTRSSYGLGSTWYECGGNFIHAADTNKFRLNSQTIARVFK